MEPLLSLLIISGCERYTLHQNKWLLHCSFDYTAIMASEFPRGALVSLGQCLNEWVSGTWKYGEIDVWNYYWLIQRKVFPMVSSQITVYKMTFITSLKMLCFLISFLLKHYSTSGSLVLRWVKIIFSNKIPLHLLSCSLII